MRAPCAVLVALTLSAAPAPQSTVLRAGSSPQLAVDTRGVIRAVFGRADTIFAATSRDGGVSFGGAVVVGIVPGMHLGNTRGPVVASSRTRSLVAATDTRGNTHVFQLDHAANAWARLPWTLNTAPGAAPEGLGTVTADTADTFYAVWLDYRDAKQTQIYFARLAPDVSTAPPNERIYASPDGHVCECCRPSVAVSGTTVAVLFRNWLGGNRDMYLLTSSDRGRTFGAAEKLGRGTWKLDACPMDGGAVALDASGRAHTVWRRELTIYYATPGAAELKLHAGRNPMLSRNASTTHIVWQDGPLIKLSTGAGSGATVVGEGRFPHVVTTTDGRAIVAWERAGLVHARRM